MHVAAAIDEGGVHAHQGQAVGGQAERFGLGLVFGVDVGDAEMAGGKHLRLVGRAAARRRADGGHAGGEHHALHFGA